MLWTPSCRSPLPSLVEVDHWFRHLVKSSCNCSLCFISNFLGCFWDYVSSLHIARWPWILLGLCRNWCFDPWTRIDIAWCLEWFRFVGADGCIHMLFPWSRQASPCIVRSGIFRFMSRLMFDASVSWLASMLGDLGFAYTKFCNVDSCTITLELPQ